MAQYKANWIHQHTNGDNEKTPMPESSSYLKHRGKNVKVTIFTISGKRFIMLRWKKRAQGQFHPAHIFECPPVFVNGQKVPWSDDIFQGIENWRHMAKDKEEMRFIEILDSNYFNELLLKHINE